MIKLLSSTVKKLNKNCSTIMLLWKGFNSNTWNWGFIVIILVFFKFILAEKIYFGWLVVFEIKRFGHTLPWNQFDFNDTNKSNLFSFRKYWKNIK